MQSKKSILILGGDLRQEIICRVLLENGYECEMINDEYSIEELASTIVLFDVILLPVPISRDKINIYSNNKSFNIRLDDIIYMMNTQQILIGGCIFNELKDELSKLNIEYFDFYEDETLVMSNAYLTAQGCLKLLLDNTNEYIKNKKVLITGFGRVASATAALMHENSLDVYICVRNELQKIEALHKGYKCLSYDDLNSSMHLFDFIFNTVPAKIFDDVTLSYMSKSCKYFEIASVPYGVDKKYFEFTNDKFIMGNALPGKYLPKSAGRIIAKTVIEKLK